MQTIQIRLPKEQLEKIDKEVKSGLYKSRSEAVRDYLKRMEFLEMFDNFQQIIDKESIDRENLTDTLSSIRKKVYKKYL